MKNEEIEAIEQLEEKTAPSHVGLSPANSSAGFLDRKR